MNGVVVDASVTLSWCFPDEQSSVSLVVLDRLKAGDAAIVPSFWSLEVLNALLIGEKRGRISPKQTAAFLEQLQALNPTFDYASLDQVYGPVQTLCRNHRLTPVRRHYSIGDSKSATYFRMSGA